jgi:ribose transport system ATP-binding protein
MSAPLLRVRGLSKSFPGLRALDDVELEVASGEVLAVVGQNGSGKSTLVKILAGLHDPDPGAEIEVRGADGTILTGAEAQSELHFIHQDLGLIPMLSTVENLDLGRAHRSFGLAPAARRAETRRARELIARFGASFDVTQPLAMLSAAERAIVAIARALEGWQRDDHVLVLDEPTAALHGDEVGRLFEAVRHVAARGAGVIFISHRLDEVMDIADRVVALRDGRVVADIRAGDFDRAALVHMIVGRELTEARVERTGRHGEPVLRVDGLAGGTVAEFGAEVRAGEIVGITGLLGSGREHVAGLVFGAVRRDRGTVRVGAADLLGGSPRVAVARDVAFVPADRRAQGAVMTMNVRENLTLPRLRPLRRLMGRLDGRAERAESDRWVGEVGLRPAEPERRMDLFSGGNQQKVVLAKWLRNEPSVLLLDEPTQGVDVGAKASIYELVARAADKGAGVVISSSDTKELALLCDRVMVMRDGSVVAELSREELTEARMVQASLGGSDAEALHPDGTEGRHAR